MIFALAVSAGAVEPEALAPANILLIMADDVSAEAFESYVGSPTNTADDERIDTPRLDELATGGMRYLNALACPLCTPSRVALMTGQYNFRNYRSFGYLDNDETTFARVLQMSGYSTAIAGKWQLSSPDLSITPTGPTAGSVTPQVLNDDYGFDSYMLWQLNHTKREKGPRYWNPTVETASADGTKSVIVPTTTSDYGPDMFVNHLKGFISNAAENNRPFLAYYAMALSHSPWMPTPDQNPGEEQKDANSRNNFDDNIEYIDTVVGELIDHLDDPNGDGHDDDSVRKNTLIIFTSDNGTARNITLKTDEGTVTGDKGTATYHGTHVPLILNWAGTIQPGVSERMVDFTDIFRTLTTVSHAAIPADLTLDGVSLLDPDGSTNESKEAAYVWYDPKGHDFPPVQFSQDREFKLYSDGRFYHIDADPAETENLSRGTLTPKQEQARAELQQVLDFYAGE